MLGASAEDGSRSLTAMIGETLSHYRVTAKLGQGGMGEVFLAEDASLGRKVAIKVLAESIRQDRSARKRLLREAKLAAALDHPYICGIHELLEVGDTSCIVMEYVEGRTLKEVLSPGALRQQDALQIGLEISEALDKAHQKGIVHRDLKPANIMVTPEGHVKVMDFGLAMQSAQADGASQDYTHSRLTREGMTVGTLAYMSPEQVQGGVITPGSDLFSLGIVLYEMLNGVHPFKTNLGMDTAHAILHDTPPWLSERPEAVSQELQGLLRTLLAKQPGERGTAHEARSLLARLVQQSGSELASPTRALLARSGRAIVRPRVAIPALLVIACAAYLGYQRTEHSGRVTWARDVALPEVARLTDDGKMLAAFDMAAEAERYLPANTPALVDLRRTYSRSATIRSDPPGATVSWNDYSATESGWRPLGQTPVKGVRIPAVFGRIRIEKEGYQPLLLAISLSTELSVVLDKAGSLPPDMVRVPASVFNLTLPGLDHLEKEPIKTFLIDKFEVTNAAYKRFVDGGGYREKKYWTHPFIADGRTLTWEKAIDRFKDRTGRTGPATWEAGTYPDGQAEYPVSGVSWYEAAAFAEFVGKSLPTVYHWYAAAGMTSGPYTAPLSNLGRAGAAPVGSYRGVGPYGTYDMAGNVREWCWNDTTPDGQRFILGGGWDDPAYSFSNDAVRQSSFDRSASNGFRCMKYLGETQNEATSARTIATSFRDLFKEKPASEKEVDVFVRQYAYDRTPLNEKSIAKDTSPEGWTKEVVSFDTASGSDRVIAYVFLPKTVAPPYQVVFRWGGDSGLQLQSSDAPEMVKSFDFIVKSGRAVMFPVLKGMFERRDGLESTMPNETVAYRDRVISWVKEVRRSVDYLETRPDIAIGKLAYFGQSWGARMAGIALAVEPRFKVAVLHSAGFRFPRSMPEVDPFNFVSRVRIPVLMLNGRYDSYFPVETAQKPMFTLLGTPEKDKDHRVYDGGHVVPRDELVKETLAWLDRHLGSVK
jgi:eukaryotic-like serine/threonine-protein kinase